MNTTVNISIAGIAFVIEEEAYDELAVYLDDIRTAFAGDSSADEIVSDIEERIAELLKEKCISGMVVNLQMVRGIKRRIGDPKEMASEESDTISSDNAPSDEKSEKKNRKSKRIYRSIDERVLGGVCAGLGIFFGMDKVIFRIVFLLMFGLGILGRDDFLFFLPLVGYLCLWIAMPAARTVEQKREMMGLPMNLEGYRSKDFNLSREIQEVGESPAGRTFKRVGEVFIGIILLICGLGGLLSCIFLPSMPEFFSNRYYMHFSDWGIAVGLITDTVFWGFIMAVIGLACIGMLYGSIMMIFDLKKPSWRPGLVIFISWLLCIFVFIAWILKYLADALPTLSL